MAENGNLRLNNNNSAGARAIATTLDQGRTESDATHFRLRGDLHTKANFRCLSCGETFASTSLLEVYEHYGEKEHPRYFKNCLYCQGKVHQYCHTQTEKINIYHNCLRWKRGEDR